MKNSFITVLLFIILFSSYCYYNAAERNTIQFKDSFSNVELALLKMERLIKRLPPSEFNINYEFKNGKVTINDGPGKGDSLKYITDKALGLFSQAELKEFQFLAKYLNDNYISAGYLHYKSDVCLFVYHDLPGNTFDDTRDIAFLKDAEGVVHKTESQILDKKGLLILVAPKGAKIYDNFTSH